MNDHQIYRTFMKYYDLLQQQNLYITSTILSDRGTGMPPTSWPRLDKAQDKNEGKFNITGKVKLPATTKRKDPRSHQERKIFKPWVEPRIHCNPNKKSRSRTNDRQGPLTGPSTIFPIRRPGSLFQVRNWRSSVGFADGVAPSLLGYIWSHWGVGGLRICD
jgi:hypothetical protein